MTRAIPRDYQLDPVKDTPLHVDFLRLAKGQEVKVMVPFHIVGQDVCPGIKRGGTLQIVEHSIELSVPSESIPDAIEISVATLDIGGTVHLSDVKLPNGAKPLTQENVTIATIVGVKEETAEPAAEGAAAEAPKA